MIAHNKYDTLGDIAFHAATLTPAFITHGMFAGSKISFIYMLLFTSFIFSPKLQTTSPPKASAKVLKQQHLLKPGQVHVQNLTQQRSVGLGDPKYSKLRESPSVPISWEAVA